MNTPGHRCNANKNSIYAPMSLKWTEWGKEIKLKKSILLFFLII